MVPVRIYVCLCESLSEDSPVIFGVVILIFVRFGNPVVKKKKSTSQPWKHTQQKTEKKNAWG